MSLDNAIYTSLVKVSSPVEFIFTEHNRSTVPVSYEYIENSQRMANGTMRKYVIAKKRNFTVSWTMLPSRSDLTIDQKQGAEAIQAFHNKYYGQKLTIVLKYHGASASSKASYGAVAVNGSSSENSVMTEESIDVFINSFSYDIQKRLNGPNGKSFDYVNLSIGFVEA